MSRVNRREFIKQAASCGAALALEAGHYPRRKQAEHQGGAGSVGFGGVVSGWWPVGR